MKSLNADSVKVETSANASTRNGLRNYQDVHIDQNCENIEGFHENELFYNCTFRDLRGVTLKDCVLAESTFLTDTLKDALGFTFTVGDCNTFADVEYSPFLFDLLLVLMCKTKGNTEKRKAIIKHVLGEQRLVELLHELKRLEQDK